MEAENGDNAKQSIEQRLAEAIAEGREIKTRGGLDVRIYSTDAGGEFPIHGAIRASKSEPWALRNWTVQGRHQQTGTSALDLAIQPSTIELDHWCAVFKDGSIVTSKTPEPLKHLPHAFALINIKRTVTEGEGL